MGIKGLRHDAQNLLDCVQVKTNRPRNVPVVYLLFSYLSVARNGDRIRLLERSAITSFRLTHGHKTTELCNKLFQKIQKLYPTSLSLSVALQWCENSINTD